MFIYTLTSVTVSPHSNREPVVFTKSFQSREKAIEGLKEEIAWYKTAWIKNDYGGTFKNRIVFELSEKAFSDNDFCSSSYHPERVLTAVSQDENGEESITYVKIKEALLH